VFLAYRTEPGSGDSSRQLPKGDVPLSLLFVDPEGAPPDGADGSYADPTMPMSFAPAAFRSGEGLPDAIVQAVARLAAAGGGEVIVDSWDPSTEALFRAQAGEHGSVRTLLSSSDALRAHLGRLPVRAILSIMGNPEPEMVSMADGIIHLGWEESEGFQLRVVSIPKMRTAPMPETHYLYSLEEGKFYCPPQFPPGFQAPLGSADPDLDPTPGTLFPGSQAFADAFGRLVYHGLTGIEVPPRFPSRWADVFFVPLTVHALNTGGRVVWIPSAGGGPSHVAAQLAPFVPHDFLRERLRVLSAGIGESDLGDLRPVALPLRREVGEGHDVRAAVAPPVGPLFPDAHEFLRGTPEGRPALFLISLDGLEALAAIAGLELNPSTYPYIVGVYSRLPGFHGIGFGRSNDPMTQGLVSQVDTHLRVEVIYGRPVVFGIRPRTNPYLLDWGAPGGRYSLVPLR
jgi:hypothetical protein